MECHAWTRWCFERMAALLQTSPRPEVKYLDPKSLMPSITPTCLPVVWRRFSVCFRIEKDSGGGCLPFFWVGIFWEQLFFFFLGGGGVFP